MLNANAKAFVPGGGGGGVGGTQGTNPVVSSAPTNELSLFRYVVSSPPMRSALLSEPPQSLSVLQKLMSKRQLQSASQGGAGISTSHQFVAEFFSGLTNNQNSPCGFMLSRELLSLSAVEAVQEASLRDGFLLHLAEVPSAHGAEVGTALAPHWETLMSLFGQDFRVTMLGYFFCQIQCGAGDTNSLTTAEEGRFLHYLFVCTTPKKSQLVQLNVSSFLPVSKSTIELSPIIPRIFSPALSCAVIINLAPPRSTDSCKNICNLHIHDDMKGTLDSLTELQQQLVAVAATKAPHDQSEIVIINIIGAIKAPGLPFVDIVHMLSQCCDKVMGGIVGIIASADQWDEKALSRGLQDNWRFDPSAVLSDIVGAKVIVSPKCLRIPSGTFALPMSLQSYHSLINEVPLELITRPFITEGPLLTRKTLTAHVDAIAKESFKIRRRNIGVPVLLVVDQGRLFCIDSEYGNALVIPHACWSNSLAAPQKGIFQATLVASYRADRQYRILVHDVLRLNGNDLREAPFSQRWATLDALGLDDETCWPHGSPSGVVVLRSLYVNLPQCEQLLNDISMDSPSIGLQFVSVSKPVGDSSLNFRWMPSDSLTARFVVDELETLGATDGHPIKRAYLSCRSSTTSAFAMFKDEYCDFHSHCAPELTEGTVIECLLRQSQSGSMSHWWEFVQEYSKIDMMQAHTEDEIEGMICSPSLTLEELRWLSKAGTFLCSRCNIVNDDGKLSPVLKTYQCRPCWEASGHGDCIHCYATYAPGGIDCVSGRFYCDACWGTFTTPKGLQAWAPPPPPDASFAKIVSTRVISLFIDRAASKGSNNDILELCCGGSVVRKWIHPSAGVGAYVGIDISEAVVDETITTIKAQQQGTSSGASPSSPTGGQASSSKLKMYNVICGDAFDTNTWVGRLAQVHPTQFHTITCFGGLHRAFSTEQKARDTLFSISNALVPNGLFLGSLWSANALLRKGFEYENSSFHCTWDENATPRVGSRYTLEFLKEGSNDPDANGDVEQHYVIPLDFLVAVAAEFKLELIREFTFTFADLLADDDRWTRPLTADEKELLAMRMTFGFRKSYQREASSTTSK